MATGSSPNPRPSDPRQAFRMAMARYKASRLAAIRLAQGMMPAEDRIRPAGTAEELTEHLDSPAAVEALAARLPVGSRLALSLMAVTEATAMPAAGLSHALEVLGVEPAASLIPPLELGLLAIDPIPEFGPVEDFAEALERSAAARVSVVAHPTVLRVTRPVRPEGPLVAVSGPVAQVREADGLEAILRLGALWQRAGAEPIRQTQQGTLYKRDRERVLEDPVLAGPIADAMAPLPDLAGFWLALARRVGVLEADPTDQRLTAAPPGYWSENAVHLPQMIATGWMSLRGWQEPAGAPAADLPEGDEPALPYLRPAVLLWLATLEQSEWAALDDLAAHLSARCPSWDRPTLLGAAGAEANGAGASAASEPMRRGASARGRAKPPAEPVRGAGLLESILLGAAYPLGLVRAAEERGSGRRLVQLTPMGRYVLAAGPTPPPRTTFDQFLFVQPNFEVIAYRQGLSPQLVGRLSRFARWAQVGAALELRLDRESILFGLEGGLDPQAMLDLLRRHSQRELPAGVVDAVRTWATHRERVTYYAAATLLEFASLAERDAALASWPRDESQPDREPPIAVGDRFLLMEDEQAIPFDRFRMAGSRDYRRPPDECVAVEADGVSMVLDPSRSDLMVNAEIGRFADERPAASRASEPARRRFVVTAASLRRGLERGLTPQDLADWYERRTGDDIPPAVRLLLTPTGPRSPDAEGRPDARSHPARRRPARRPAPAPVNRRLAGRPAGADGRHDRRGPPGAAAPGAGRPGDPTRRALSRISHRCITTTESPGTVNTSVAGRVARNGFVRRHHRRLERPASPPFWRDWVRLLRCQFRRDCHNSGDGFVRRLQRRLADRRFCHYGRVGFVRLANAPRLSCRNAGNGFVRAAFTPRE